MIDFKSDQSIERDIEPSEVLSRFEKFCHSMKLTYKLHELGADFKTFECQLFDQNGAFVTLGFGKGRGVQSKVSAVCEALEHFWSIRGPTIEAKHIYCLDEAKILAPQIPHFIPESFASSQQSSSNLPWVDSHSLLSDSVVRIPQIVVDPFYIDRPIGKDFFNYSKLDLGLSTSGQAVGVCLSEALVHSVCERIERDSVSSLMIKTFLGKGQKKFKMIRPHSLPDNLKELYQQAVAELKQPVLIIDITTDLGVPAFYATIRNPPALNRGGSGASLNAEYACERAIRELLQIYSFRHEDQPERMRVEAEIQEKKQKTRERFKKWPSLLSMATGDFFKFCDQDEVEISDFSWPKSVVSGSTEHLSILKQKLSASKIDAYYFVIDKSESTGLICVSTFFPQLEDCIRVETGQFWVPKSRAQEWVK